ncbi:MAG: AAA family ATPase [Chitinophagaceae bacterium]|nr:AAA family ATPase [Chitinophagaceae bacterium]
MPNQKKIISIELENYRAYYGKYAPIALDGGENLLIYGENGSGKSSLFKAINNFLANSISAQPFIKNRYLSANDGKILIGFDEFDATGKLNLPVSYQFGANVSNNNQLFIQSAALIKGFLDYTKLLDIYFKKEAKPNLFNLVVTNLLADHISSSTGATYRFGGKWKELQVDLIANARSRRSRSHKAALLELPNFETHLRGTLDRIFVELNRLLRTYFTDLNLEVSYDLKPMNFFYGSGKDSWHTTAIFHFIVKRDGIEIADNYSDYLNEARLSAFAICIYLASLKINPSNIELKVLYLDDIFIGLDAANRVPIMDILMREFSEYQIFLSTYDRHTYEVAKRQFAMSREKWKCIEFYVGTETLGAISFDKPIIVSDDDNYTRALFFLHHAVKPDYPAAANYFRKHAEDILTRCLPEHEIREDDLSQIAGYQLTKLVNAGIRFLRKVGKDETLLQQLKNALPTLLHPLSHFNLSSPVYKKELLEVQNLLPRIESFLVNIIDICTPTFHAKHPFLLDIRVAIDLVHRYRIFPKEMIYVMSEPGSPKRLSIGDCHCESIRQVNNVGAETNEIAIPPHAAKFQYQSLSDAYDKLFDFNLIAYPALLKSADYINEFSVYINQGLQPLATFMLPAVAVAP